MQTKKIIIRLITAVIMIVMIFSSDALATYSRFEKVLTFHSNGKVKFKGTMKFKGTNKNGDLEGLARSYHENGRLQTIEFYRDGERQGTAKTFSESGQLTAVKVYDKGKVIRSAPRL